MASTYSTSLKLELIGNGDQSGTWGTTTNNNLGTLLEQAITGVQAITMSNVDYTLSNLNGVSDEARNAVLVVGGTNSAIRNIIAPAVNKTYIIVNNTSGGYAINIKTPSSTGVNIPNGTTGIVYCNGTEFYTVTKGYDTANTANTLVLRDASGNFAANVITGNTTTQSAGDNSTKIASTAYVNSAVTTATGSLGTMSTQNANAVAITGGTISASSVISTAGSQQYNNDGSGFCARMYPSSSGTQSIIQWVNYAGSSQWTSLVGTNGVLACSTPFSAASFSGAGTGLTGTASSLNAGIGVNQTWTDVTSSRANNTTYTNSTGKPILISFQPTGSGSSGIYQADGNTIGGWSNNGNNSQFTMSFIVPNGQTYKVILSAGSIGTWWELR